MHGLGLPLTVLRPVAFMELMTTGFFPVSTWHLMPKLMGADRPVWWIGVEDLGAIAACAFADPDRFIGSDLPLATDIRSIAECRETWREVTGRRPRSVPMPQWLFERFVGTDLTTMWRWLRTADIDVDPAQTRAILPTASEVRGVARAPPGSAKPTNVLIERSAGQIPPPVAGHAERCHGGGDDEETDGAGPAVQRLGLPIDKSQVSASTPPMIKECEPGRTRSRRVRACRGNRSPGRMSSPSRFRGARSADASEQLLGAGAVGRPIWLAHRLSQPSVDRLQVGLEAASLRARQHRCRGR